MLDNTSDLINNATDATVTATTHAQAHNNVADSLIAIETALGINPKGSYASVAAWLADAIIKTPGSAQTITPSGDTVPLILKSGSSLNVSNMQEWRDASSVIQAFMDKSFILSTQGLKIAGTALSSVHLSDSAQLARLASPAFTGTPTSPTPTAGDNTTKIATTAFVAASFAPLNSPALSGTPTAPTPTAGDNSTKVATTAFVATSFAPLASPSLTGTPTAPTPANGDNSSKIATTAFVANNGVPTGSMVEFAGSAAPSGWLLANGAAVSRSTYSVLFGVIGTTYGAGDGSTTFNLPDLRGRVPVGLAASGHADVATLGNNDGSALASRRPKHNHTHNNIWAAAGGGWQLQGGSGSDVIGNIGPQTAAPTDAPAYLVVNFIIKT